MAKGRSALTIRSLEKSIEVLEAFIGSEDDLSLSDISKRTMIEKSAVQRALYTLRKHGFLVQDERTRRYALGQRFLDFSHQYLSTNPLVDRATPVMVELRRSARERADLSIFCDTNLQYIIRFPSKMDGFFKPLLGRRIPSFCSAGGRACMAHLASGEIDDIIGNSEIAARTSRTIICPEGIRREIDRAREQGFALQVEESLVGEVAVAAAFRDEKGRPLGAVHLAGSLSEWSVGDFKRKMAPLVCAAASEICFAS